MRALVSPIVRPILGSQPELVYRRFERGELANEVALSLPIPTLTIAVLVLGVGYLIGRAEAA